MTALIIMWLAFSWFGVSVTGLFSPEYVDAPWSMAKFIDLLKHIWLAGSDPGAGRHGQIGQNHARQSTRRAEEALCRNGAGQGYVRMAIWS